ncbi:hypothetical protein QQS21_005426 [Conoideocrella luteorostrata]|uniref:Polyketide synthase n=1 Tax=Conoideocrella luteorostrata TaxID=1105319 RepID=A0AAJ0CPE8_9HYPO|nr:hypothetical protein QQS21_005426 [Conoideocrella luteorostrata]
MPSIIRENSFSSDNSYDDAASDAVRSSPLSALKGVHPAVTIPGYLEKPIDEQLEPIAVIGMGCRLPGEVASASEFWDLMMSKGTGQTPKVPSSRFNIDAYIHHRNDRPGSFGVLGGYFLEGDLSDFDPALFGISPVEAMWMDPQQRKLLEVVYEALESGGVSLEKIAGTNTAVFAASFTADWQQMAFKEHSFRHNLAATGVDPGIISNRISHVFNLNGPSIMCNTACSSSMYALHNACNALRNREAEAAIVGGVNLIITADQHMNTAKLGVLSPTSTCHTFDASANGYGRADAVGAVYIKRLSDAIRAGDPVRAVIRSSATNSNGKVFGAGITHPNREGQANVIAAAYKRGGDLDPRLTGYFECHGTGTPVGDPLEVHAVAMAMNKNRHQADGPLLIGAVKTNIGHSGAASGLSALIKAVLIVERGVIPATRGVANPSPAIKWHEWQVKVPNEATVFPPGLPVRRVSINSFGYGGTNAHLIVEGAKTVANAAPTYIYSDTWASQGKDASPHGALERRRPFLLAFSAHDEATLRRNIDAHGAVADRYSLLDLSHTLGSRRSALSSRAFTVATLDSVGNVFQDVNECFEFADKKRIRSVGFVFTGQGAQWGRMGAELMAHCPSFLRSIRDLDFALKEITDAPDWKLEDILLQDSKNSPINDAEFAQPLCTAVQVAMVQLLDSWGIKPAVTVGHSSGEIAASYAAGLINASEAIIVAYYRGKVAKDCKAGGAMMAVGLGAADVQPYLADLEDKIVVACHNSPSLVTLSGDEEALTDMKIKFDAANVFARLVKTNGKAYHSHYMTPIAETYRKLVMAAKKRLKSGASLASTAKMVSSVTGAVIPDSTKLDGAYWKTNLCSPVLFNQAVQTILAAEEFSDVDLLIEVGPHSAMAGPIKQITRAAKANKIDYIPTLRRGEDCAARLLNVAGQLFLRGYSIDMGNVCHSYSGMSPVKGAVTKGATIVDLPPYQWNYTRPFWAESRSSLEHRQPKFPRHDLLGQRVVGASLSEPTWRNILRVRDLPWLRHHQLGGESVFPAAGYFSMATEAIRQINEFSVSPVRIGSYVLRDVSIKTALVTPDDDDGIEVLFNMRSSAHGSGWWDWNVSSIDGEGVNKNHMSGSVSVNTFPPGRAPRQIPQFSQRATGKTWNDALRHVGFDYGPTFQDMDDILFDGKCYQSACTTNIRQTVDPCLGESRHVLHPASIDSALQLCIVAIHAGRTNVMRCGVVPVQVDEVTIWPPNEKQLEIGKANAYAVVHRRGERISESDVQISAEDGTMVMEIVNMRAVAYEAAVPQKDHVLENTPYGEMVWELDFDNEENRQDLSTEAVVGLALFKYPSCNVVEIGYKSAAAILRANPRTYYTVVVSMEEDFTAAKSVTEPYRNATVIKADLSNNLEGYRLRKKSFDILIGSEQNSHVSELRSLLKDNVSAVGPDVIMVNKHCAELVSGEHSVQIVYRSNQSSIVSEMRKKLESSSLNVTVTRLEALVDGNVAKHVVMLADFEGPLLLTLKEQEFSAIQNIVRQASSVLWVTPGSLLTGKNPEYAMVSGLARVITSEQSSLDFRTLDVDGDNTVTIDAVKSTAVILDLQLSRDEQVPEREFCLSSGKTYISRLVGNDSMNDWYASSQKAEPRSFHPGDRISVASTNSGAIFQQEELTDVQPRHVEVQVVWSGISKEGVLAMTGADYSTNFSHEIGGIVTRMGADVANFAVGDTVVGFSLARFDSYQQVPAAMLCKLHDQADMRDVVSTLTAYATATYGLEKLASVREGETVLVLNKTGFAGIAAIKMAQHKGAIPYAVAKNSDEVRFLQDYIGLDSGQIIDTSSEGHFSEQLHQLTKDRGVDVVFSAGVVDGDEAHEAWRCISSFGRFLDSGRKTDTKRNIADGVPFQRGACYMPFDLVDVHQSRPERLSALLPIVVEHFRQGYSVPPGMNLSVDLGDIGKHTSAFSDDFGAVKPVVQYRASETDLQVLPARRSVRFRPDASYLLVGCLGGLGRSLASWMMASGARRFTFMSRSGSGSESGSKLVHDLEAAGASVQVVCGDAASFDDVRRAVGAISPDHPIKGVIHAAMVLRDALFDTMTFEAWEQSTRPKVAGAVNLSNALADESLDFFIMTSSVSGILGTAGQGNYAAANAYLDSLSRHRRSSGRVATSIVLPMVLGVGVVAGNAQLEQSLKRKGMYGIDDEHFLQSFEAAITSCSLENDPDHIVVGLDPAQLHRVSQDAVVTDAFWQQDARFSHIVRDMNSNADSTTSAADSLSILSLIDSAATIDEATSMVKKHFVEKLARMMMLAVDDVNPEIGSIASYGIDSMIGSELRNWIFREYRIDVPFQQLLGPTLTINKFAVQYCTSRRGGNQSSDKEE